MSIKSFTNIKTYKNILQKLEGGIHALFDPELEKKYRALSALWITCLFLIVIFFWAILLHGGDFSFDFHDWAEINGPRLTAIRLAMEQKTIPFHISDTLSLHGTDRFFSLPDVITTPQMILLLFLELDQYVFVNKVLLISIGTLGLLQLKRKYKISLFVFSIFYLLFNLNGHIQAHTAVGHITWGGYFLFPWFVGLLGEYLEGHANWRWVAKYAFLMFFMVLQGSEHHFVWILIFSTVLAIMQGRQGVWLLIAMIFSVFINAVRLLPPAVEIGRFRENINFLGGYSTLGDILFSMWHLPRENIITTLQSDLSFLFFWEFDLYVGILGTVFVILAGLGGLIYKNPRLPGLEKLILPTIIMIILSTGKIFGLLTAIPIPLLAGERATSRLIILPFTILLFTGALFYQDWLDKRGSSLISKLTQLVLLFPLINDLLQHTILWNVTWISVYFNAIPSQFDQITITNRNDPVYYFLFFGGTILTLATNIILIILTSNENSLAMRNKTLGGK